MNPIPRIDDDPEIVTLALRHSDLQKLRESLAKELAAAGNASSDALALSEGQPTAQCRSRELIDRELRAAIEAQGIVAQRLKAKRMAIGARIRTDAAELRRQLLARVGDALRALDSALCEVQAVNFEFQRATEGPLVEFTIGHRHPAMVQHHIKEFLTTYKAELEPAVESIPESTELVTA